MLYWCLIPRSGQKFLTFSDSSKEWTFSSFLIWNDGPLRRLIKLSAVWSVIPYRGEKWDSFKILKYQCWKSQVNTLIHSSWSVLRFSIAWQCPFVPGVWVILISTELLCPKSSQQHPFCHLGYNLLRNVTFNFPPLDSNPANIHVLEMVHVSAPWFGGLFL